MSNEVNVVAKNKNGMMLEVMRTGSNLPVAKMRDIPMQPKAHKELIKLVQRLFVSGPQSARVVVFSAVESGSGCTFVCTRTAEILANQLEEPVCLVDANFRSQEPNQQFEFDGDQNIGREDEWRFMPVGATCKKSATSNLWLVSYRPAAACPSLASLERFQTLLDDLRNDFTYVIVDAPPLNEYADAQLFARMADGLVMVLEANDTRRDTALNAKQALDAAGIPVLGAVLNNRTFPIPDTLYRKL